MTSTPAQTTDLRCDRTRSWAELQRHWQQGGAALDLRQAFAQDAQRFESFRMSAPEVVADLSKNRWDVATRSLLLALARECQLPARRDAMLRGELANPTEGRPVLHTALRAPRGSAPFSDEVHGVLDRLLDYVESVRADAGTGFTDVVNIGIGGSDLGPQMAVPALEAFTHPQLRFHFVSNVDGHDLVSVLQRLNPATTLFVIASKTFTTQETMANAAVARRWFLDRGRPEGEIARHFVATTTNLDAAAAFGITTTFGFWDWVGGRYSMWSAIGLPIALALGAAGFRELLAGAHAMDRHFAEAPLEGNLPIQLGLLDVWYRNFHGFSSRSIAPYHQGLRRLPAYLQQLEMESNGKCVDLDGQPVPFATCPVIWGEAGTNGQHAYFQMLHQGSEVIPVEFIAVRQPDFGPLPVPAAMQSLLLDQHRKLLANCLAQSQALMLGKSADEALRESAPTASQAMAAEVVARHRTFLGNRPSTTLLLQRLTPRSLGALIALYEHRVWTSGALWGINSFDQWGVELGKALCNRLLPRFESGDVSELDGSTAGLLGLLRGD